MSVDTYYTLGRSGLRVSRLALGTMTFGTESGWGSQEDTARQLLNTYIDVGGNFIDTADLYTNGTSEAWIGKFVAERKLRDRLNAISRPEPQFPYTFFDSEIQGMIHSGKPVGLKPTGYSPNVFIESAGAGVS